MLGTPATSLAGSHLAFLSEKERLPAPLDEVMASSLIARARALRALLLELIEARLLTSAQDVSDGGLAVALAESCIFGENGFEGDALETDPALLYGEPGALLVVSTAADNCVLFEEILRRHSGVAWREIGTVVAARHLAIGNLGWTLDDLAAARNTMPYGMIGARPGEM